MGANKKIVKVSAKSKGNEMIQSNYSSDISKQDGSIYSLESSEDNNTNASYSSRGNHSLNYKLLSIVLGIALVSVIAIILFVSKTDKEANDSSYHNTVSPTVTTIDQTNSSENTNINNNNNNSSFSFYDLSPYENENGEVSLLKVDYLFDDNSVLLAPDNIAFIYRNGITRVGYYSADFSSVKYGRGPYGYQVLSDKAISVQGYAQEIIDEKVYGPHSALIKMNDDIFSESKNFTFVTMTGLDLDHPITKALDGKEYTSYKLIN